MGGTNSVIEGEKIKWATKGSAEKEEEMPRGGCIMVHGGMNDFGNRYREEDAQDGRWLTQTQRERHMAEIQEDAVKLKKVVEQAWGNDKTYLWSEVLCRPRNGGVVNDDIWKFNHRMREVVKERRWWAIRHEEFGRREPKEMSKDGLHMTEESGGAVFVQDCMETIYRVGN